MGPEVDRDGGCCEEGVGGRVEGVRGPANTIVSKVYNLQHQQPIMTISNMRSTTSKRYSRSSYKTRKNNINNPLSTDKFDSIPLN